MGSRGSRPAKFGDKCKLCNVVLNKDNCILTPDLHLRLKCRECYYNHKRNYEKVYNKENSDSRKSSLLKTNYGISIEQYKEILEKQNGKCAICNQTSSTTLHVDHNHNTEAIRQLLCSRCNLVLGMVKEDIGILNNLINYIVLHSDIEKEFNFQHD